MAAANESQGLKIAVAAFIALTVILTVTCYFLYYGVLRGRRQADIGQRRLAAKVQGPSLALNQYEDVQRQGRHQGQEYDQAKEEISAHFKKIDQRLDAMINAVNTAVRRPRRKGPRAPSSKTPSKTSSRSSPRCAASPTRPTSRHSTASPS